MKLNEKIIYEIVNKIADEKILHSNVLMSMLSDRVTLLEHKLSDEEVPKTSIHSSTDIVTGNNLVISEGCAYLFKEHNIGTFVIVKSIKSEPNDWTIEVVSSKSYHSNDLVNETTMVVSKESSYTKGSTLNCFSRKASDIE